MKYFFDDFKSQLKVRRFVVEKSTASDGTALYLGTEAKYYKNAEETVKDISDNWENKDTTLDETVEFTLPKNKWPDES